jgi:NAD(P)H-dependent FMN reductase
MLKVAIVVGSTRPGRKCEAVANWAYEIAQKRKDAGISGALKNAIDFLFNEWGDKAAGFVGYGYTLLDHVVAWSGALKVLRKEGGQS